MDYTQIISRRRARPVLGLVIIVALVLSAFVAASLISHLAAVYGFAWIGHVSFVLLLALAVVLLNRYIVEYSYELKGNILTLEKRAGRRVTQREVIELNTRTSYGPYVKRDSKDVEELQFAYKPFVGAKMFDAKAHGFRFAVVFSPDEVLDSLISDAVGHENEKHREQEQHRDDAERD